MKSILTYILLIALLVIVGQQAPLAGLIIIFIIIFVIWQRTKI